MGIGGGVCLLAGGGFLVALLVGSLVLRAAVSVANRVVGPVKPKAQTVDPIADYDWDDEPEEEEPRRRGREKAIPEPGVGKGMMIASTVGVLTAFFGLVLGVLVDGLAPGVFGGDDGMEKIALAVITLPFGFAATTLVLVPMLPTTFWRAGLVAFVYHFISLALVLTIAGVLVAAWHAVGP